MKERPILFSGRLVRAILAGTKTQTRRPVTRWGAQLLADGFTPTFAADPGNHASPYGYAGDRLWVRETWAPMCGVADPTCSCLLEDYERNHYTEYRADTNDAARPGQWPEDDPEAPRWRPSIHMPRARARLLLEVTGVRIERLGDITEEDAQSEGVTPFPRDPEGDCWTDGKHRTAFEYTWGEIYGWEGPKSFNANPWVWVVSFRRVEP